MASPESPYVGCMLGLADVEVAQCEQNRIARHIKAARSLALKELPNFELSAVPKLDQARVLDLARGENLGKRETILLVGNPGPAKTHLATANGPGVGKEDWDSMAYASKSGTGRSWTSPILRTRTKHGH